MSLSGRDFWALVRDSVTRPREVVRGLLAANLPRGALWQALLVVAIFAGLLAWIELAMTPSDALRFQKALLPGPLAMVGMQFGLLAILVPVIQFVGRMFGGKGDAEGALKVVVWWQALTLVLQVAEFIVLLILPPLAIFVVIATLIALIWTLTNGIAELHGFQSLGLTLLGIIASGAVLLVVLSMLLTALGVPPIGVS